MLQALAPEGTLALTSDQWRALADVTLEFQAIRQAYEATLAQAVALDRGSYRLEIPAYPVAGDALRARFQAELRARLGETAAADIVAQLGGALEGHFAGFGVSTQTLDFIAAGADADYQVTRTVRFWNSLGAGERLTVRRETHFPGLEDPSGHTWGPFLSVLAAQLAAKSGS